MVRSDSSLSSFPRRPAALLLGLLAAVWFQPLPALVITEIMYNPTAAGPDERPLEWVEIFNDDPAPLDISGYFFSSGISYTFPDYTFLEGYAFLVVCANQANIRSIHGIDNVIGNWDAATSLDNSGEGLAISNPSGAQVARVRYNDRGRWPAGADGAGHSLSMRYAYSEQDDPDSWTLSAEMGGSPGRSNFGREDVTPLATNPGLDISGFITTWLVLGPYGDNAFCPGRDRTRDWLAGGSVRETDLFWRVGQVVPTQYNTLAVSNRLHPNAGTASPTVKRYASFDGAINLNDSVWPPDPNDVMGYAMVYVDNVTQGPLLVDVGVASDDSISVLVNGNYVMDIAGCRGLASDVQDRAPATLNAGKNLIMAKTFERGGGFSFRLRLEARGTGTPLTSDRQIRVMTDHTQGLDFGEVGPPLPPPPPDPPPASDTTFPIRMNEALIATSGERWVELYNASLSPVSLAGHHLSDDRLDLRKATLPAGTSVPGRGFLVLTASAVGLTFEPDGPPPGGRTFVALSEPGGQRVLDAYTFEPKVAGMSEARFPDGDEDVEPAATPTPGAANAVPVVRDVVVNEVMYHPIDEDSRREYLELFNRGPSEVDLTGWRLSEGVNFDFPAGARISAGGYLVVARDPDRIRTVYGLPAAAVLGPAQEAAALDAFGVLRDRGERITLLDPRGNRADSVRYHDGGEWPRWADGGGSSLELVDARTDNSSPQAWDSSDDSAKATVQTFGYLGRHAGGESELQFLLLARGISLVDDVKLASSGAGQVVLDRVFIEVGDLWRYLKGFAPGAPPTWADRGFDDSGPEWLTGATGIGYDDADDATVLTDMLGNYTTIYCRKAFDLPPGVVVERLFLSINYDDGFVAYLNGAEVARRGLLGVPPAFDESATSHDALAPEVIDITAHKGNLVTGSNVLSVEVHNTGLNSGDLSFIPRLYSMRVEPVPGGANVVSNGTFDAGAAGWRIEGTHIFSGRTTRTPITGGGSLKLVATGRGDNKVNRIETDIATALDTATDYEVSFKARWVVGSQSILTRGYNHGLAKNHQLAVPPNTGTPGAVNSATQRRGTNLGPVIGRVVQNPPVPGAGEQVEVLARVSDPDGVSQVTLRYALNTPGTFTDVAMTDPDGDGIYRGVIPGQAMGTRVVFHITARDAGSRLGRYPVDRFARTHPPVLDPAVPGINDHLYCVYRHAPRNVATFYHPYRFWLHQANEDYLSSRQLHSNDLVDGSFIYRGSDIYHNSKIRFSGSPFARQAWGASYRIQLPRERPLHGAAESFNLDNHHGNATDARERISHYLLRYSSGSIVVPYSIPRLVSWQVNDRASGSREHVQVPDDEFISFWYPEDEGGEFFEMDDRFEFNDGGGRVSNENARWTYPPYPRLPPGDKESYRWYFNLRADEDEDDYNRLVATADFMTRSSNAAYDAQIDDHLNVEEVLRVLAIRLNTDDWDSWGGSRGKNCYLYRPPTDGRWALFAWDMELTYGNVGAFALPASPAQPISYGFTEVNRLVNRPRIKRMYYGILKEMVDNHFRSQHLAPYMQLLAEAGMSRTDIGQPGGFIDQRRNMILGWINTMVSPQVDLRITTGGGAPFTVTASTVNLDGIAPVEVSRLVVMVNGAPVDPAATVFSNSSMTGFGIVGLPLEEGLNQVQVLGFTSLGTFVDSASIQITLNSPLPRPTLTEVIPGSSLGGRQVEVLGSNFRAGLRVFFGSMESPGVVWDAGDPDRALAMVPANHPGGSAPVKVRNSDGQESAAVPFTVVIEPLFIRGDANRDRLLDVTDAVKVLFHLFRGLAETCPDVMDVNDDGVVALLDAALLLQYLFQGGEPPQAPFPGEGRDTTQDGMECR